MPVYIVYTSGEKYNKYYKLICFKYYNKNFFIFRFLIWTWKLHLETEILSYILFYITYYILFIVLFIMHHFYICNIWEKYIYVDLNFKTKTDLNRQIKVKSYDAVDGVNVYSFFFCKNQSSFFQCNFSCCLAWSQWCMLASTTHFLARCVGAICAIIGWMSAILALGSARALGLMEECFPQLHLKNNSICHCWLGQAIYEWTANQFRLGQKHASSQPNTDTGPYRKLINDNQSKTKIKKEAQKYANEIIKRQTGIQFPFYLPILHTLVSQSVRVRQSHRHLLGSWTLVLGSLFVLVMKLISVGYSKSKNMHMTGLVENGS